MKLISYKQEMGDMERICTQEGPTSPAQFQNCWEGSLSQNLIHSLLKGLSRINTNLKAFSINSKALII